MRKFFAPIILLLMAIALCSSGCTTTEILRAEMTELNVAPSSISEKMLLDIGIINFDLGIPKKNDIEKQDYVYPEVRAAEARYLPYHLKITLQGTGFWGAVRVIPSRYMFTDIIISGVIEQSDGEYAIMLIKVEDALGKEWFQKSYSTQTGYASYADYRNRSEDPYQKMFNDFANDLREYVMILTPEGINRIREVSELKFFADMAPNSFGEHLATNEDGTISIVRLPAENDPAVTQLRQIRERDRLVVDTLNEHYANFYYGVAIPYEGWRKVSREEHINYRQVKKSARMRMLLGIVVVAGSMAMDTDNSSSRSTRRMKRAMQTQGISHGMRSVIAGWTRRKEAKIHLAALKELSDSFISEASPMVVTIDGETRRLTGTAEAQYETWRKLLKQLHETETGFTDVKIGMPTRQIH